MSKRKKLTGKLKEQIKRDYRKLRQADFDGEALAYLKQVRGGHKGQKSLQKKRDAQEEKMLKKALPSAVKEDKKGKPIVIGDQTFQPGSKVYEVIELSATNKGQSIKAFVKEHERELEELMKNYLIFAKKEIDDLRKLIKALPDGPKIFSPIKLRKSSKKTASLNLHLIKKTMIELGPIYPLVFIEYAFDLTGNLHFNCPRPGEYKEFESWDELKDFIDDQYPNITYIEHDSNL